MKEEIRQQLDELFAKESWAYEDFDRVTRLLFESSDAADKLRQELAKTVAANPEPRGAAALKIGMLRYALCQFRTALELLGHATDNKDRHYMQALCHKVLRQWDQAAEALERARQKGWDPARSDIELAELKALSGAPDAAEKVLGQLEKRLAQSADWWYVRGLVDELNGRAEQACDAYEKSRAAVPGHTGATFRLAYVLDLHGQEDRAIELYRECLSRPPVHVGVLLNLAVLCEDRGQYDQAAAAVRTVLATNPNHPRARLFLKDIQAGRTMYYDEDQIKRLQRRNAILDIPVTDFELSVRARNCLKKMNIRTLGDLIRTGEAELLSYKNFGETSLKEIKDMLAAKGLRLGQALEDGSEFRDLASPPAARGDGILATPIAQLGLSVRANRAMETLRVKSLGDLTTKTEAELLACKNFGQTSLNEIRQRLAEFGLKLRELS